MTMYSSARLQLACTMTRPLYSQAELQQAYEAWVNTPTHKTRARLKAFEVYCDVRDGLPIGTTAMRRLEREPIGDERVVWMDLDG